MRKLRVGSVANLVRLALKAEQYESSLLSTIRDEDV